MVAELLDVATMQALMQLDVKLYITVFEQPKKSKTQISLMIGKEY